MSKKKLAAIIVPCVVAIVVLSTTINGQCGPTALPVVTGSEISIKANRGGVLKTPDGLEISVPRNAAPSDTIITVKKLSQDAEQLGQLEDGSAFGEVWEVKSSAGSYFEDLITIKLPYDENNIPSGLTEENIFPIYLYEGNWYPLPATVDTHENVIIYQSLTNNGGIGMAGSLPWGRDRIPTIPGVTTVEQARAMLEKCESDLQSVQDRFDLLPGPDPVESIKAVAREGLAYVGYKALETAWTKASATLFTGKVALVVAKGVVVIKLFALVGTVMLIKWVLDDATGASAPREAWDLKVALARYNVARANLYLLENEDARFLSSYLSLQIAETHESLRQWGMGFDDIWTYELLEEEPHDEFDLTISSTAGGSVEIPGEGAFVYDTGTVVSLVAAPASGYRFVNWAGDTSTVADVNAASTTITMNGDYSITANFEFEEEPEYTSMIAAGGVHTVGLKNDGTVVAVGGTDWGECEVGGWTGITQVAAGNYHTVGLKSNGTVVAVGENGDGQCDVGGWTDISQVAAGGAHTVGLKSNGTVVAVGYNSDGQCDVGGWTDITQVAAGGVHTVGLKNDGTVVAVGWNAYGICDVGGWTGITQVAAGDYYTVGLKSNGTVVAVGYNVLGQCNVGGWTGITQVAAGNDHTMGVKSDGTVVAVGRNADGQCNVGGWTGITQVAAGSYYTVGLKSNGTVVAVGYNYYGQCNVGGWTGGD